MQPHPLSFNKTNQRLILLLMASHLLWSCAVFGLWALGGLFVVPTPLWQGVFVAFQLYAAAQLLLPVLLLHPEQRNRGFYILWGLVLMGSVWLLNQLTPSGAWLHLLNVAKSSLLLLVASITGAALARYVKRLWEIVPVCIVMTLADFASWFAGPTAGFTEQIQRYYLRPEGPPPLVDMVLVKFALPSSPALSPVFGMSDWIMVVFFAIVARRHDVNDNLVGEYGELLARKGRVGRYLPVSVVALLVAIVAAQTTGLFIPALPFIAVIMLLWYAGRYTLRKV